MTEKHKTKNEEVTRRDFLGIAWGASVLALFGQASVSLLGFFKPRGVEAGAFGSKIIAGHISEFEPGTVSHVQKGRFFISRLEDEGMIALWHRCTHLGCTVPWDEANGEFRCPCHSSVFNTKGEVMSGPAPRPLDLFPIEVQDEQVVVDTGNPITRSKFEPSQATYI